MKVLVCINEGYARDQQIYVGEDVDNIHGEEYECGWQDASGEIVLAIKNAADIESAVREVADFYECSADRFTGYQLA